MTYVHQLHKNVEYIVEILFVIDDMSNQSSVKKSRKWEKSSFIIL